MSITRVDNVPYEVAGFGSRLTHDLARGEGAAAAFFPVKDWKEAASRIDERRYPRAALCKILEREARRFSAPEAVLQNIARLGKESTYVVATGQQAGFLGGPLYSLHKALSAIQFARKYEAESGGRNAVVPIFWVAGDDHDLAEIDHAGLLGEDGNLLRVRAPLSADSLGRSACDARLNSDPAVLATLRDELSKVIPAEAAERLVETYRDKTLGDAFTALIYQWLGETGLVVVQSQNMRGLSAELLLQELNGYESTGHQIREAGAAMRNSGYEPGFSDKARVAPHFFIASEPALIRAGLESVAVGQGAGEWFQERSTAFEARNLSPRTFAKSELAELIQSRPELFSSAAALRPVLQQRLFPVVAAVLGPGEIAYWAQLGKVHEQFNAVFPYVVPRASVTLLDAAAEKNMRRLGLAAGSPGLFLDFEAMQKKVLKGGEAESRIDSHSAKILGELDAMAAEVHSVDGGLKPLFDKAREKIAHELQRIAEKTRASIAQRDVAGTARVRQLSSRVRPGGEPQERVLCTAQFMLRYPGLPAELLSAIDPAVQAHFVVALEG